jgi:hypothetical protein
MPTELSTRNEKLIIVINLPENLRTLRVYLCVWVFILSGSTLGLLVLLSMFGKAPLLPWLFLIVPYVSVVYAAYWVQTRHTEVQTKAWGRFFGRKDENKTK